MTWWQGGALAAILTCAVLLGIGRQSPIFNTMDDSAPHALVQSNPPLLASAQSNLVLSSLNTFQGASVDGALRTDHKGQLIIDSALRHWIDFHLSAQGERSLAEITAYMQEKMQALAAPGNLQALALLEAYLGYLQALSAYDLTEARRLVQADISDIEARVIWQQRLRRQWLSDEVVQAFFSMDESIDLYTLEKQKLLVQQANEHEIAALEETLPKEVRAMRKQSRQIIQMLESENELLQQGASEQTLHQWRTTQYGEVAAQRLAEMDKAQAAWQQRLKDYRSYQQSPALQGISDENRGQLLLFYKKKHFSSTEQKRLEAALSLLDN